MVEAPGINRVSWLTHIRWMRENFFPGQHISVIVPTGGGKSHLAVEGILKLPAISHARVLYLDDKHKDKTTRNFGIPIAEYPISLSKRLSLREHTPHYRLLIPDWTWSSTKSHERGVENARNTVGRAINAFYNEADDPSDEIAPDDAMPSILVADETYALVADKPPSLNLRPLLVKCWRKGRFKAFSVIALTQEPIWMPSEFYTQASHLYLGKILDQRQVDRLREIGGNTKLISDTVSKLGQHEFLFLGNKGDHMQIVKVGR